MIFIVIYCRDGRRRKTVELAEELIKLQLKDNINAVVATPHFNPNGDDLTKFLQKRAKAFDELKTRLVNFKDFNIKCAAEVLIHPQLLKLPQKQLLCIEGTNFMLTELPSNYLQDWMSDVLFGLLLSDITPILAHAEKYSVFLNTPSKLYKLVTLGMLVQIDASSIISNNSISRIVFEFIKHNLVHFIATDTHSADLRPPHMNEAFNILEKKFDSDLIKYLSENAVSVFNGINPDILEPIPFKDKVF